ncbi:MAG: Sir2 family NAD-dependent protein deacetylase [Myxococcales bacterium]|jgi:NAD-dependent deacetylase
MDPTELQKQAEALRARLTPGQRLLFITGAGLSAESGLPTYRGVGGLYEGRGTEHGMPIEMALSGPVFLQQPEVTWKHLFHIGEAVRGATHNLAHGIIARLERDFEVVVLTQNVDGFHRTAGSTRIIDIHGDCRQLLCTACDYREQRDDYAGLELPPRCPRCDAVIRPDVVLFEEMLPQPKVMRLLAELQRGFDAYFSVGTSSLFPYVTEPMEEAARRGKLTVEINPGRTDLSDQVEFRLGCGAGGALSAIFPELAGADA